MPAIRTATARLVMPAGSAQARLCSDSTLALTTYMRIPHRYPTTTDRSRTLRRSMTLKPPELSSHVRRCSSMSESCETPNESDNGKRSLTVAKSAALLPVSLHGQRAYRPADVTCGGRRRSAQSQRVSATPASSNRSAILPWRAFQAVEVKPHRSLAAAGDATGVGTAGAPSPTRQQFRDSCELAVRLAARVCVTCWGRRLSRRTRVAHSQGLWATVALSGSR
jgi:hypothetical protein